MVSVMAAFQIIIALSIIQSLQIEAILNRGYKYHQKVPSYKQKRLTENAEAEKFSKGDGLRNPDDPSQSLVKDPAQANTGYTISHNFNKTSGKGFTVLEVNFIKNNYYLNPLSNNKSEEKSDTVNKNFDRNVRDDEGAKSIDTRGNEMLKVVNFGNKPNNTGHVIDKIVFPDTNITALINSHNNREGGLNKNGEQTNLRAKPFDEEKVEQNQLKIETKTVNNKEITTKIPIPITNAPIVDPENNAKDESHKKFVLIPLMPNNGAMIQEGKPITFYPVSVDRIKQFARDSTNVDAQAEVPRAANTRNVNVQEIDGNYNNEPKHN